MVRTGQTGVMQPQPGGAKGCRESPRARDRQKDPPLGPSEGARPCQRLDLGLLTSRTVRKRISVVLSGQFCGALFWAPQETDTDSGHPESLPAPRRLTPEGQRPDPLCLGPSLPTCPEPSWLGHR